MYSSFSGLMNVGLKYDNSANPVINGTSPAFTSRGHSYYGNLVDKATGIFYTLAVFTYNPYTMDFSTNNSGVNLNIICVGAGGGGAKAVGTVGTVGGRGGGGGGIVIMTNQMVEGTVYTPYVGQNDLNSSGYNSTITGFPQVITAQGGGSGSSSGGSGSGLINGVSGKAHPYGVSNNNPPGNGGNGGAANTNGSDSTINIFDATDRPTFYHTGTGSYVSIYTVVPYSFTYAAEFDPPIATTPILVNPFHQYSGGGGGGSVTKGGCGINGVGGVTGAAVNNHYTNYGSGGGGGGSIYNEAFGGEDGVIIIWAKWV